MSKLNPDLDKELKKRGTYTKVKDLWKNDKSLEGRASHTFYNPTHLTREKVPLAKLKKSDQSVDEAVVNKYAAKKPNKIEPVDVSKVKDTYYLVDGHHRVMAAQDRGEDSIDAVVSHRQGYRNLAHKKASKP